MCVVGLEFHIIDFWNINKGYFHISCKLVRLREKGHAQYSPPCTRSPTVGYSVEKGEDTERRERDRVNTSRPQQQVHATSVCCLTLHVLECELAFLLYSSEIYPVIYQESRGYKSACCKYEVHVHMYIVYLIEISVIQAFPLKLVIHFNKQNLSVRKCLSNRSRHSHCGLQSARIHIFYAMNELAVTKTR